MRQKASVKGKGLNPDLNVVSNRKVGKGGLCKRLTNSLSNSVTPLPLNFESII